MNAIRQENRLPSNYPLIVVLLNIHRNNNENSQVEYGFYSELSQNKFYSKKPCSNINSTIIFPMKNIENINLTEAKKFKEKEINVFNESDEFFNDLCYQYSDEYGNDVTLSDRYNNYYQNVSFCDDNCVINGYDFDLLEVNCSCKIKESISYEINENKNNIKENKSEGLTIFDIGKCNKNTFKNLKNNIGSNSVGSMALIQVIGVISYLKVGLNGIKSFILIFIANPPKLFAKGDNNTIETNNDEISSSENISNKNLKNTKKEINLEGNFRKQNSIYDNNKLYYHNYFKYYINEDKYIEKDNDNDNNNKLEKNNNYLNDDIIKNDNKINYFNNNLISRNNPLFNSNELIIQNINSNEDNKNTQKDLINQNYRIGYGNNMSSDRNSFSILRLNKNNTLYESYIKKPKINLDTIRNDINKKFIKDIIDNENLYLNELDYFNAKKLDKRSFCQFYCDQIKHRQSIIYIFLNKNPIEPTSMKIIIFCFQLILCFITNCLFYSKKYLSNKYYSKQKNDFIFIIKNTYIILCLCLI